MFSLTNFLSFWRGGWKYGMERRDGAASDHRCSMWFRYDANVYDRRSVSTQRLYLPSSLM